MIKQDLIQRVVERTGLPRTKAEAAVDAIFESMKKALGEGDRIELRGFGVFTVKPRKTGVGRNPRTGAEVTIAPGKAVRFKPGKELHLLDYPASASCSEGLARPTLWRHLRCCNNLLRLRQPRPAPRRSKVSGSTPFCSSSPGFPQPRSACGTCS